MEFARRPGVRMATTATRAAPAHTGNRRKGVERRLLDVVATVERDPDAVSERARTLVATLAAMFDRLDGGQR